MKRNSLYLIILSVLIAGCSKTQMPIAKTPKPLKQLSVKKTKIDEICDITYKKVMAYNKICENKTRTQRINEIAEKIISNIKGYPNKDWKIIVLKRNDINAACLANGIIFVNEGIFRAAKTDDQIAAILAHEIAHALLEHGQAKIQRADTSNSLQFTGSIIAGVFNPLLIIPYLAAYEGIKQPLFNHYSRLEEKEADALSLKLMHQAGYNVNESIKLWQNIKQVNVKKRNKKFSTHASYNERIKELKHMIHLEKKREIHHSHSHTHEHDGHI